MPGQREDVQMMPLARIGQGSADKMAAFCLLEAFEEIL